MAIILYAHIGKDSVRVGMLYVYSVRYPCPYQYIRMSTSGARSCPPAVGGGRRRLCRLGELCPSSAGTHWAWPDGRRR